MLLPSYLGYRWQDLRAVHFRGRSEHRTVWDYGRLAFVGVGIWILGIPPSTLGAALNRWLDHRQTIRVIISIHIKQTYVLQALDRTVVMAVLLWHLSLLLQLCLRQQFLRVIIQLDVLLDEVFVLHRSISIDLVLSDYVWHFQSLLILDSFQALSALNFDDILVLFFEDFVFMFQALDDVVTILNFNLLFAQV